MSKLVPVEQFQTLIENVSQYAKNLDLITGENK